MTFSIILMNNLIEERWMIQPLNCINQSSRMIKKNEVKEKMNKSFNIKTRSK
jgi:hypothetical protein